MKYYFMLVSIVVSLSCNEKSTETKVIPYNNINEFNNDMSVRKKYDVKMYLKLAVSTDLPKQNFTKKSEPNIIKLDQIVFEDTIEKKYIMILSDSLLLNINSNDEVYLKSLLSSSQKCFSSMLYTSSFANSSYSNVGKESLFILLNLKYRNHFLRSSDIGIQKDSLMKLIQ